MTKDTSYTKEFCPGNHTFFNKCFEARVVQAKIQSPKHLYRFTVVNNNGFDVAAFASQNAQN